MKKLSFKKRDKTEEVSVLEDGLGTSIEITKLGCVTVFEELAITKVWSDIQQSKDSFAKLKLEALAAFLSCRFEDESLTPQKLAVEAGSQAMIDVLYTFMENERARWLPSSNICRIEGSIESLDCAKKYAQENHYVVATREDLKINNSYYIFKSLDVVPESFEVVFDYSNVVTNNSKKNGLAIY
jgi:hypothetical protein